MKDSKDVLTLSQNNLITNPSVENIFYILFVL